MGDAMILPGVDTLCANLEWDREFDRLRAELAKADDEVGRSEYWSNWRRGNCIAAQASCEQALLAHIRKARL